MPENPARPPLWNLPNALTGARLVLTLPCCAAIANGWPIIALVTLGLASLTDWLDGQCARRMGLLSAFGRQFDPLADKVFVSAAYVYLLAAPLPTGLMPWMVAVIVCRELVIQAIRAALEGQGIAFGAVMAGKLKTTFQFASLIAILLVMQRGKSAPSWLSFTRDGLTWVAVLLTIYSGLGYLRRAARLLADRHRETDTRNQPS